jgi:hypothetical protein
MRSTSLIIVDGRVEQDRERARGNCVSIMFAVVFASIPTTTDGAGASDLALELHNHTCTACSSVDRIASALATSPP